MRMTPIKPVQITTKQPLVIRLLKWVGIAITYLLLTAFFAVVILEWLAGCGESYVDAQGSRHYYECVFIPFNPESSNS